MRTSMVVLSGLLSCAFSWGEVTAARAQRGDDVEDGGRDVAPGAREAPQRAGDATSTPPSTEPSDPAGRAGDAVTDPPATDPPSTPPPATDDSDRGSGMTGFAFDRSDSIPWEGPVDSRELGNGLLARVQQRRDTSFAAVCLVVAVGNSDDPDDHAGLAHLTEHLLFAPTAELPNGFGAFVEVLGASYVNASTDSEATTYCTEVPHEALERVLYAEAMRQAFLLASLDEDDVDRERAAVLHEQRERQLQSVGWIADVVLARALFGDRHPYARPRESPESVGRISLDDVRWFFQRWYGPRNVTLSVVSPVDPAQVHAWIARHFGAWRGFDPPERPRHALPTAQARRWTILAPSRRDHLRIAWTTPRFLDADDAALDLAADELSFRLGEIFEAYATVRYASVRVRSRARASSFEIELIGGFDVDLSTIEPVVTREIERLVRDGLSLGQVERAQRRFAERTRPTPLAAAGRLAKARVYGQAEGTYDERYATLTQDLVNAAIRRWLQPNRRVVVHRRQHAHARFSGTARRGTL